MEVEVSGEQRVETVDVRWHAHAVSQDQRELAAGHKGCVLWFTGLSGCGKSTLANLVDHSLNARGFRSFVLDGDNVRLGLNASPGLLKERYGEAFAERFGLGFSAQDRDAVRAMLAPGQFVEVYVRAPLSVCEQRDPKGLYKKARAGEIIGFTGIDDPYEEPLKAELVVDSASQAAEQLADQVIGWLEQAGTIPKKK